MVVGLHAVLYALRHNSERLNDFRSRLVYNLDAARSGPAYHIG